MLLYCQLERLHRLASELAAPIAFGTTLLWLDISWLQALYVGRKVCSCRFLHIGWNYK
jgi:hypothetical protein